MAPPRDGAAAMDPLATAAASRAHAALAVARQLQEMLREYTALEAQHAARLRALAERMGDCVDRLRAPFAATESADNNHPQEEEEEELLRARQGQCVAAMDAVVTFLARFASMHRDLSDCLTRDLFDEWDDVLAVQQRRMAAQEPELTAARDQLQMAERAYRDAHAMLQEQFDRACASYAAAAKAAAEERGPATTANDAAANGDDDDPVETIQHAVREELAKLTSTSDDDDDHSKHGPPQRPARSPSKAMQYVGSISRLLRASAGVRNDSRVATSLRDVAESIQHAERERRECYDAYQAMHRLHVRLARLVDSLHQEYRCVQSECLASTKASVRKLVVHVSAFTSNLQYDATQLFQDVETLHAIALDGDGDEKRSFRHHGAMARFAATAVSPATLVGTIGGLPVPVPPSSAPLTLEHIIRRRLPAISERPRLLRHQNACHGLAV